MENWSTSNCCCREAQISWHRIRSVENSIILVEEKTRDQNAQHACILSEVDVCNFLFVHMHDSIFTAFSHRVTYSRFYCSFVHFYLFAFIFLFVLHLEYCIGE
jgi:hypothetical protein